MFNKTATLRGLSLFLQFLKRDFYQQKKQIRRYITNYCIIKPALFSISIAYIQAHVLFGAAQKELGTFLLIGNAMIIMIVLTFTLAIALLFDLEGDRFIDYQMTILDPKLLLIEKIVFSTLLTFFIILPFFPISKLMLQSYMVTVNASWGSVLLLLLVGSLCMSTYNMLCTCLMKGSQSIISLWVRVNLPLLFLGGLWAPLYMVKSFFPHMSFLLYLNPIMYITEGLKSAILGDGRFLSVGICCLALLAFSGLLTASSLYFFKKRVDHV